MIEVKHLTFAYEKEKSILDIESFRLKVGEKVFLFGPSGSGKTTLLGLLTGVLKLQAGSIHVAGADYARLSQRELDRFRGENIGYIFQSFNLLPYLSVRENILLPVKLHSARRARLLKDLKESCDELAERLGITHILDSLAMNISVGQAKRVAAARCLIGSPGLIIADEPTSSLDTDHRERFIQLLIEQAKESRATILFVSHDRSLVMYFDRAVDLT